MTDTTTIDTRARATWVLARGAAGWRVEAYHKLPGLTAVPGRPLRRRAAAGGHGVNRTLTGPAG
ncbi:hypothetical protein [Micromonospora sp. NPDC005806]|uniref:hypothetical protein n=1 Tax=Micromonospora sp. NPDC005806 TaxID=3364234 RepID=UPI0036CDF654